MSCIDHKDITPLSKNGSIIAKLFKFNIDVFLFFLLTTIAYELGLHTLEIRWTLLSKLNLGK